MALDQHTFRSKVDVWLVVLVAGGVGAMWLALLRRLWAGRTVDSLDIIVPLQAVQRLRATHNPLSSPALSLDRIEVSYGERRVLISPQDKGGFVTAVLRRSPAVVLEGLSPT